MIHSAAMKAATILLVLAGAVSAAVPHGVLLERPVVMAVQLHHAGTADAAAAALAEIAKARFPEFSLVRELPKTLSGPLVAGAESAKGAFALSFLIDPARPAQHAQVCALAHAVAEKLGAELTDGETGARLTAAQWKEARLDTWQGTIALVTAHVQVRPVSFDRPEGVEVRGMRRFGLPDLVLEGVTAAEADAAASLLLLVAQQLVERPVVENGTLLVKGTGLSHAKMKTPRGGAAPVKLAEAKPGFTNPRRFALVPEPAESASAMLKRLMKVLGGPAQEVAMPPHVQAALDAASARAQSRIRELARLWQTKPVEGAELLVKAPFATATGGREWMWVEVVKWEAGSITGTLKNAPGEGSTMNEGQTVVVPDAELFDYLYTAPGAEPEGGQTDKVLEPGGQ